MMKKVLLGMLLVFILLISIGIILPKETTLEGCERQGSSVTRVVLEEMRLREVVPEVQKIHLVSVGDIMMHDIQISSGYNQNTGVYDYCYMFDEVKEYIEAGDLAIGNLELTMAGENNGGYTGYPCFNAPESLGVALKDVGFDVLTTANNHSLDRGFKGVLNTIDVLDGVEIKHTGTFKSKEAYEEILIREVKGVNMAFLSYTYGTNGIKVEKGKEFSINYIDKNKIKQDIVKARNKGANVICVAVHYGAEYIRRPSTSQKELVEFLVDEGVDIVLGGHPHVLQPVEIRENTYEEEVKKTVILYSQGNFISAQRTRYREQSAIFNIILERDIYTGKVSVIEVNYIPIWVDQSTANRKYNFRVLDVHKSLVNYTSKQDELLTRSDYTKLERALRDIREILKTEDQAIYEKCKR